MRAKLQQCRVCIFHMCCVLLFLSANKSDQAGLSKGTLPTALKWVRSAMCMVGLPTTASFHGLFMPVRVSMCLHTCSDNSFTHNGMQKYLKIGLNFPDVFLYVGY